MPSPFNKISFFPRFFYFLFLLVFRQSESEGVPFVIFDLLPIFRPYLLKPENREQHIMEAPPTLCYFSEFIIDREADEVMLG